ncbi:MAG: hypothetical protein E5X07_28445 [Mesorhizobium sp.]|uniref:hypothetical protein n=1 Tax=Mesorhizobium sp. TaxID=1871066 RepID=UPI001218D871|nr:hypothetical protein [Mesorhizobium sp.]TIR27204.1 MAG: hypothetical protein E5X35_33610 [Mesorhizobium sp.]TIS19428.1 MAG: hypothetical protein E5X07_28445 [Mesorhizobium sp.]
MTRKEAALNQTALAIRLFHEGEFAGAITLALAAEGQMAPTTSPHVLKASKEKAAPYMAEREFVSRMNEVRDWLKHHKMDPLEGQIVIAIFRTARENGPFLICTPDRGVIRGHPILADGGPHTRAIHFEDY